MKKIGLFFSLFVIAAMSVFVGFIGLMSVKADGDTFVANGAGIMISSESELNENGIRFNIIFGKEEFTAKTESGKSFVTGVLVLPTDLLEGELNLTNYGAGQSGCINRETTDVWTDAGKMTQDMETGIYNPSDSGKEYMSSYVYVYNIPEESYNRSISF